MGLLALQLAVSTVEAGYARGVVLLFLLICGFAGVC